jgi:non-heme Fe2+,alpha-ketoglutarate-dependent halogenase
LLLLPPGLQRWWRGSIGFVHGFPQQDDPMKALTEAAVRQYRDLGYCAPVAALATAEAGELRRRLEAFESGAGPLSGKLRHKPHLLFTWLNDLVRHPRVLDAVEDIIGPDILCWGTSFFIKERKNPGFVSWHQDSTYWGLEPPDIITAWVAFTDSNAANGAMRVIPGTHKMDQVPHRDTFAAANLLSRGQEISVDVDESQAAMLELAAGEMSLHHVRLIHGSDPNPSDDRRIGFAIRFRDPLHPDLCAPGCRHPRQRDAGARWGSLSPLRGRAASAGRHVGRSGGLSRSDHRRARGHPDARHRQGDARVVMLWRPTE